MKTVIRAKRTFSAWQLPGAYQPGAHQTWGNSVVSPAASLESIAGELSLPMAVAHFRQSQPGERLLDGALALLFVAACAATGWVGAVLL